MRERMKASIVVERTYKAPIEELWALWTTKEGFASWWGPQGFRADVHMLDGRPGGALHYDMAADTPEMVAAMREMGESPSHETRGTFTEFKPHERLVLTHIIDFLPGVEPYENEIVVQFFPVADGQVRMVVTLSAMHDPEFTRMQQEGFASQLSKLDQRYGWRG
ncbi:MULTISPECIES: SRPBCC family protein [Sphingomonas]|nr:MULTISPECIES: SRPBCC domain-containing protein [Sphingomonas]MDX3885394.1 SRPBCC domain-containing protein [Sphingomonas sp.]